MTDRVTLIHVYDAIQTLRAEIASNYAKKETVEDIQEDLRELKKDVKTLNNFRFYFVGIAATTAAVTGFAMALSKDFIVQFFTRS